MGIEVGNGRLGVAHGGGASRDKAVSSTRRAAAAAHRGDDGRILLCEYRHFHAVSPTRGQRLVTRDVFMYMRDGAAARAMNRQ